MVGYFQPGLLEKRSQNIKHSAKTGGKKENWILPPRLDDILEWNMLHIQQDSIGFNRHIRYVPWVIHHGNAGSYLCDSFQR